MLLNAKNATVRIGGTDMDYISFGRGNKPLVMLPGLGDGLTTVKGMAFPLAVSYRLFAKDYQVFIFSRKNGLERGSTTRTMARDQAEAMKALGIRKAGVIGISQGGMIAQYLAIDYPEFVGRLVLAVTAAKPNRSMQSVVNKWIALAKRGDYRHLMIHTAEKSYSETYLKKYRYFYPVLGKIGKPENFSRFLIQANSCLNHNAYWELGKISCPTLVIGGDRDRIVGCNASKEIAGQIKNSELFIYEGLGHASYEEASDFNKRILKYLAK